MLIYCDNLFIINEYQQNIKRLQKPSDNYKTFLDLTFIIRWIERIGNLSTNIAEDVIFMESAQDIRHGGELEE